MGVGVASSRSSGGGTATSFVQRARGTYQDNHVHIKVLPVKLLRFERHDLIELKWVKIIQVIFRPR